MSFKLCTVYFREDVVRKVSKLEPYSLSEQKTDRLGLRTRPPSVDSFTSNKAIIKSCLHRTSFSISLYYFFIVFLASFAVSHNGFFSRLTDLRLAFLRLKCEPAPKAVFKITKITVLFYHQKRYYSKTRLVVKVKSKCKFQSG